MENEIVVTIDGREVTLAPTSRACTELSRKYGGMLPLMDVLNLGNLEAATDVMFYALAKRDSERAELRDRVYDAGLRYLAPHLVRYVIALTCGGRVPEPVKVDEAINRLRKNSAKVDDMLR